MSLNETVSAERVHISFFGRRNAGKSSLMNAITGQSLAVVSDVKGTTTDPVKKSMELLPIGPVVMIDTPGFDDEGTLGELRVQKTREILAKTDVAVLVLDATEEIGVQEQEFLALLQEKKLPFVVVHNKVDMVKGQVSSVSKTGQSNFPEAFVSATKNFNIKELKDLLGTLAKSKENNKKIVADLLEAGDVVILVTPIDESAPKGRPNQNQSRRI